ncbi:MAG: SDR family oxidoreductase [Candidatus Dojkabacteria bacterium]|nr:SDR family oxidoreductase [Candidatus Dojkabacteria bacterium]MDQ7020641.1 SDR family oxidoreductase [Candidatus Dojkabacteria bacterium]
MENKKVALITGGTKGIGLAIASELGAQGYSDLILVYRSDKESANFAKTQLKQSGASVKTIKADISLKSGWKIIGSYLMKNNIELDLLVNNAGIDDGIMIEELDMDSAKNIINTNLLGTIATTKVCIPFLKKNKGQIINISKNRFKKNV